MGLLEREVNESLLQWTMQTSGRNKTDFVNIFVYNVCILNKFFIHKQDTLRVILIQFMRKFIILVISVKAAVLSDILNITAGRNIFLTEILVLNVKSY